jgi:O-antigen polymerase
MLLSTLAATVNFSNFWYIHVSTYLEFIFGVCIVLILITFSNSLRNKIHFQLTLNLPDVLVLAWIFYYLMSFILSANYNQRPDNLLTMAIMVSAYFFIRFIPCPINQNKIKPLIYIFVIIGTLEAIYSLLQLLNIMPNIFPFKFGGSFGNPGDLANLLVPTFIVSMGITFYQKNRKLRYILLAISMLQITVIIISGSRTAWISSFILSVAILYYFKAKHLRFKPIFENVKRHLFIWALVFSAFILSFFLLVVVLYNFKPSSVDGRVFIYKLSKELISEKPLFGHGYNSFFTVQHQKQIQYFRQNPNDTLNGWLASSVAFAFNDYLQIAIEFGCLLLIILIILLWRLYTFNIAPKNINIENLSLLFICRTALGSILICMLFSYPLENPSICLIFFTLAALISNFDTKNLIKSTFKRAYIILLAFIGFIASGAIISYSILTIVYGLNWKQAFKLYSENPTECVHQYGHISKFLNRDFSFVQNYSSILLLAGEYEKCARYCEEKSKLCLTTEILETLGQSYEQLKDYQKAEESYKNASYFIPHRFIPKFQLFQLYLKMGNDKMAESMAIEIRNMKIKVFSSEVKNIKTEVNKWLSLRSLLYQ